MAAGYRSFLSARNMSTPRAIVLSRPLTGLATVRALHRAGIAAQALVFSDRDLVRHTRMADLVDVPVQARGGDALIEFLLQWPRCAADERPVLIPVCDEHALLLSRHAQRLSAHFRLWTTSHDELLRIISKNSLGTIASALDLPVVPGIAEPTPEQLEQWSAGHAGPYLLKPFYVGAPGNNVHDKNRQFETRDELLDHVRSKGARAAIVQRMLRGGDGYIFDCYGLCDASGRVVQMATHRRWRQNKPDCGTTSFGEIPAGLPADQDDTLLAQTRTLLGGLHYHGIFGIEWLLDRETGRFCLIDFNARPFSSIGHLVDCGLNLPALAFRELTGELPSDLEPQPRLRRLLWVDFYRDLQTFRALRGAHKLRFLDWFASTLRCRSWAYWNWRDPMPALVRTGKLLRHLAELFFFNGNRQHDRHDCRSTSQDVTF